MILTRFKLKNMEKILPHCNSAHYKFLTECLKFNLGRHGEKTHYNFVLCFWKLISNIILHFESYLAKACISIIHLYEVKVA